ncbi:myo-inosose-2 dehydratase [Palleronia sediminis]|uniref:Myo-inosose-2 dehydratase n=1 Tax=Palleronia sediminis TaxID=2547833 RepID=A0A4V3B978_9RHOB|nr:TIM barrel protein [Palleronia sediminis]TDL78209.1 myo-inosose-2 dehydratase [Palleronia sediminis]
MIRYGTHPIAWSNDDDPTLGTADLDRILTEAAEIGFAGIEKGASFPDDPDALKEKLGAHKLDLATAPSGLRLLERSADDELTALKPVIDLLKAMDAKVLVAYEASNEIASDDAKPISARPTLAPEDFSSFGLKLEQLATALADQGLTLAYQPHMGTVVQTPDEIDRLMLETGPNLKLCFDSGHVYFGGGDPAQVLTRHLPRVAHVHFSNIRVRELTRARMDDTSYLGAIRKGVFTVPGDRDGSVDFRTCMNLLTASGFDGWVVVAAGCNPERNDPAKDQALALRTLEALSGNERSAA